MAADDTIGNWTLSTLTKVIKDIFERNPPRNIPALDVDSLVVHDKATFNDLVEFNGQLFRTVGNVGQPAFLNAWVNWGAPQPAAAFVKDPSGRVFLHGLVKNLGNPLALPSTIFQLPPGYRPEATLVFVSIGLNAIARVEVDSTGNVNVVTPTLNTAPWVTLDGINFKAV